MLLAVKGLPTYRQGMTYILVPVFARFWPASLLSSIGRRSIGVLLCFIFLGACATQQDRTLKILYERSAQYHKPDRNPVIVIPGILGSRLVDEASGRTVWGAFDATSVDPRNPEDALLLALPISGATSLQMLRDEVSPDGVLDQVRLTLLGIPVDIRAYVGILSSLGVGGYRDNAFGAGLDYGDGHFTCFQFAYDWRRDNVENARRLKAFIDVQKTYIRAEYKKRYGIDKDDIKFDIVAHSMGGLLTRYFLRYGDQGLPADGSAPVLNWAGAEDIERVILVGAPNAGAGEAFEQLLNGYDPGRPVLPHYPSVVLGTFPSIYQLLPRPRHNRVIWNDEAETPIGNIYDETLWEDNKWGLMADDKETRRFLELALPDITDPLAREEMAKRFQARALDRARRFHEALDVPATPPEGLDIFLVAGDAERTPDRIVVNRETGKARFKDYAPGDGTVPRYSALMDERTGNIWQPELVSPIDWAGVQFIPADHIGLTADRSFTNNMLFLLLEDDRS